MVLDICIGKIMRHLIESLGIFLDESRAKTVRKRRVRKRASDETKLMARQIGAALRHRVSEIERLLPVSWKFSSPLILDKVSIDKFGETHMSNQIEAEYDYHIGLDTNRSEADFNIGFVPSDDGGGWWCTAAVSDFDPSDGDTGVVMKRPIRNDELRVETEWRRKKNAFDPEKDIWPLIKVAMKELKKQMPEYGEMDIDDDHW